MLTYHKNLYSLHLIYFTQSCLLLHCYKAHSSLSYICLIIAILGKKAISYYPRALLFDITTNMTTNNRRLKIFNNTTEHVIYYKIRRNNDVFSQLFNIDNQEEEGEINFGKDGSDDECNDTNNTISIGLHLRLKDLLEKSVYQSGINMNYDELSCFIIIDLFVNMNIKSDINSDRSEAEDTTNKTSDSEKVNSLSNIEEESNACQRMLLTTINLPVIIRNISFLHGNE